MAVAGHRSALHAEEPSDISDDDAGESRQALLDDLLRTAYRAAIRLDSAARVLTFIAGLILGVGVVIGLVGGVTLAAIHHSPASLLAEFILCVAAFLVFLPMYFTPTWARAYAAKMMVDVELQWGEVG